MADPSQQPLLPGIVRAVRAQLVGLRVRLTVRRLPRLPATLPAQLDLARRVLQTEQALAVFWCDARHRQRIFLYVSTQEGDRVVLRSIRGLDEAGRFEALALILRQAVRALLAGATIGAHPAQIPPPRPRRRPHPRSSPRPSPRRGPRWGVEIDASYTLEAVDAGHVAHGFRAAVVWRLRPWWSLFVGFGLSSPLHARGEYASLRVQRYPVLLGARGDYRWRWLRVGGSLAVALEYRLLGATSTVAYPDADRDDLSVAITPSARVALRIAPRLRVALEVGARIVPDHRPYVVTGQDVREILLDPWPVRPWLAVGLTLDLL